MLPDVFEHDDGDVESVTPTPGQDEEEGEVQVDSYSELDEINGKIGFKDMDTGLMHSVLENDKEKIDEGKVIAESVNRGIGSFTPELMMEQLVKNYSNAKQIFGDRILKFVSGYPSDYIERNIRIPEFQRELDERIKQGVQRLSDEGLIDKHGFVLEKGMEIAALVVYADELKELEGKGLHGEQITKRKSHYGERDETRNYRKGDRYKDITVGDSVRVAIRRGHKTLHEKDLRSSDRLQKGKLELVYGLDASGSMKGEKIELAKKAGIALAYHAINKRDKVGLMIFGSEVSHSVPPTTDFGLLLKDIVRVRPGSETNIALTIEESLKLFTSGTHTKHLLLLTDALPTAGKNPSEDSMEAASKAISAGVTISIVGINLDKKGEELAEKIATIGGGVLYRASANADLDRIVLEDYFKSR